MHTAPARGWPTSASPPKDSSGLPARRRLRPGLVGCRSSRVRSQRRARGALVKGAGESWTPQVCVTFEQLQEVIPDVVEWTVNHSHFLGQVMVPDQPIDRPATQDIHDQQESSPHEPAHPRIPRSFRRGGGFVPVWWGVAHAGFARSVGHGPGRSRGSGSRAKTAKEAKSEGVRLRPLRGLRATLLHPPGGSEGVFPVPGGALFVGVREAQEGFLSEGFAQELQADGKLRVGS